MRDPRSEGRLPRFGLGSALGVSVFLHLVLALLGWWLPAVRTELREKPQEAILRFSFAVPRAEVVTELDSAGPRIPQEGNAPRPVERPEPRQSASRDAPGSDAVRSARPPSGPVEPGPGGAQGDPAPVPAGTADPDEPRLDLGRALRDFGETLDRSRRAARRGAGVSEFTPDAGQFPTTGYGMGNLQFETRDFDWSDYARQIYIAIWRAWHNRLYQTVDEFEKWAYGNGWFLNHANRIRFVIERSGQVSGILVESESGCDPLDASATQALAEVILPPLPPDFPKQREVVHARFLAEGSIQDMRPSLTRLKRYGLF